MSPDIWPTEATVEAAAKAIHDYYCRKDHPCDCGPELLSHLAAKGALEDALNAAPKEWATRWPDGGYLWADSEADARADNAAAVAVGHDTEVVYRTVGPWTRDNA